MMLAVTYVFNINLHGCTQSKLEKSKKRNITASSGAGSRGGAEDMRVRKQGARKRLFRDLQPFEPFKAFQDVPDNDITALLNINLTWNMLVTKYLTVLLAQSPTKKAPIATVSSGVSTAPVPSISNYSAVKGCLNGSMNTFSLEALNPPTWSRKLGL
ncbi:hypothetical protein K437DRAFT_272119 [Tilletiaria anomala UBC 951]|uniref:Uncharacterized protein n=1 Tax=Tilletiaria anomala (strain ATCC 24038 / CBS 436.72 / UBC 951) TaxID=1037660 RepID=A0A066WFR9_TILAU|nr:uncharacterized protein K437DRAFT_272119 [Tilletiaria anomala UBC 951]KDN52817.1 hypothetical protein K437DRAFT_272119 [Tilletiaria anomala UBC 951]